MMRSLLTPFAQSEIVMGAASAVVVFVGSLLSQTAQTDPTLNPWVGIVTQFGGLGLAIYLVIHHTTRTIPDMQKDHRTERQELVTAFSARCDKQETCFRESLEKIVSSSNQSNR